VNTVKTTIIQDDGTIGYFITAKTREKIIEIVSLYDWKQKLDPTSLLLGEGRIAFVARIVDYYLDEFLVKYEDVPTQRVQNKFLHGVFMQEANRLEL